MKIFYIPPVLTTYCVLLMYALRRYVPAGNLIWDPYYYVGVLFVIIGLLVIGSAVYLFRKHKTTLEWKQSRTLLRSGLYKYSRNPIYVGLASCIFGLSVYSQNVLALPLVVLFLISVRYGVVRIEEKMLSETFGKAYAAFKKEVPRWL